MGPGSSQPGSLFTGALKRRAVEVSEKRLTPDELNQFRGAKAVEVQNFIGAQALETLPPHLQPSHEQAIRMRWILSWKLKDDGTTKAKARAVLLGYQDEAYEHRATTAPVMSRLFLQVAACKGWRVAKGDVTGAFLQGKELTDNLYCVPCDEICQALGAPKGSVTRLKRAASSLWFGASTTSMVHHHSRISGGARPSTSPIGPLRLVVEARSTGVSPRIGQRTCR